jgi:hypothetical protein
MKEQRGWLWLAVGSVIAVCLVSIAAIMVVSTNARDNRNPIRQAEMIDLILEWGRLAPFPVHATNLSVQTEGNPFTRSFRASFSAPEQEIKEWMAKSPGFRNCISQTMPDGRIKYTIEPGGGANYAEAIIDFSINKVEIYVSWS